MELSSRKKQTHYANLSWADGYMYQYSIFIRLISDICLGNSTENSHKFEAPEKLMKQNIEFNWAKIPFKTTMQSANAALHPSTFYQHFYSSVLGDTLATCPESHTHAYKLQFRVSNQPNVLVTGLWEEAEVPGEDQHRHRETLTKNRELYVVFYHGFVTTTLWPLVPATAASHH